MMDEEQAQRFATMTRKPGEDIGELVLKFFNLEDDEIARGCIDRLRNLKIDAAIDDVSIHRAIMAAHVLFERVAARRAQHGAR